jgi:hypothetical protein
MLFPNNEAVFQDDNASIRTAGTLQSWFEEHEGEIQDVPWPVQSPDLNIIEPFWSLFGYWIEEQIPTSNISKAT